MMTVRYSVSSSRVFMDLGNSTGFWEHRIDKIFFGFSLPSSTKVSVEIDFAQRTTEEMQEGCHNSGDTICLLWLPVHSLKPFTYKKGAFIL